MVCLLSTGWRGQINESSTCILVVVEDAHCSALRDFSDCASIKGQNVSEIIDQTTEERIFFPVVILKLF